MNLLDAQRAFLGHLRDAPSGERRTRCCRGRRPRPRRPPARRRRPLRRRAARARRPRRARPHDLRQPRRPAASASAPGSSGTPASTCAPTPQPAPTRRRPARRPRRRRPLRTALPGTRPRPRGARRPPRRPRARPHRRHGPGARRPRRAPRRHPVRRPRPRLRHRRRPQRQRARHHRRRRRAVPAAVFDGVDYAALGTSTAARRSPSASATPARRSPTPSPRTTTARPCGSSTSAPARLGPSASTAPCPWPLARVRGRLADLLEDPALARHEEAWVEATLTDAGGRTSRWPGWPGGSRTSSASPSSRRTALPAPWPLYAQRLRGRSDQEIAEDFVEHVRAWPCRGRRGAGSSAPRPWTRYASTTCCGRWRARLAPAVGHGLRPVRPDPDHRLRPAGAGRSLPARRADRRGQDLHPGRRLLRAVRVRAGHPAEARRCAATSPTRSTPTEVVRN
ncbi:hypothetical protein SRIMM317S_03168 [Streptomyces rimosus subsp. rimosus]